MTTSRDIFSNNGYQIVLKLAKHYLLSLSRNGETNLIEMQSNHLCSHPDGRFQPQLVFDKVGENEIVLWQLPGNLEVASPIMPANFINDICITDTVLILCSYM